MICHNCGKTIDNDSTFCKYCGCRIQKSQTNSNDSAAGKHDDSDRQDITVAYEAGTVASCHNGYYYIDFEDIVYFDGNTYAIRIDVTICDPFDDCYDGGFTDSCVERIYEDGDEDVFYFNGRKENYVLYIKRKDVLKENPVSVEINTNYSVEYHLIYSTLRGKFLMPEIPENLEENESAIATACENFWDNITDKLSDAAIAEEISWDDYYDYIDANEDYCNPSLIYRHEKWYWTVYSSDDSPKKQQKIAEQWGDRAYLEYTADPDIVVAWVSGFMAH